MNNGEGPFGMGTNINFPRSFDNDNLDAFNVSNSELDSHQHNGTDHMAELSEITLAFRNLTAREDIEDQRYHMAKSTGNRPLSNEQIANAFQQQQTLMERRQACRMEEINNAQLIELEKRARAAVILMPSSTFPATWYGLISTRVYDQPVYSNKVFIGGIPGDISETLLRASFAAYGNCKIEWPGRDPRSRARGQHRGIGYIYVVFESGNSVKDLVSDCQRLRENSCDLYFPIKAVTAYGNARQVQVIPWVISDANYVHDPSCRLDPKKTIFVGGLHGMITAEALFKIINEAFQNVVYVGIDTDKYKYPIGSGRVTFSSYESFFRAVGYGFLIIRTNRFIKRIQIDPFLEETLCMVCKKLVAPYFCRDKNCFYYFCLPCWQRRHAPDSQFSGHKALTRNIPRTLAPNSSYSHSLLTAENPFVNSSILGQQLLSGINCGTGCAGLTSTSPLPFGGIDLRTSLWGLQTQTPSPIGSSKMRFTFPGTVSHPSTPFNVDASPAFFFPPPSRFA